MNANNIFFQGLTFLFIFCIIVFNSNIIFASQSADVLQTNPNMNEQTTNQDSSFDSFIGTDTEGNNVMRASPKPKNNEQSNNPNYFYIAPRIDIGDYKNNRPNRPKP